ncbi:MAG: ATP-grasp domain-containing protein, partial [Clostridia bacterium]|nr:ATP-grasp domain-containing protein [Clostridia bacterium]
RAMSQAGIPCPRFIIADNSTDFEKELSGFSFPIIVKPTDRSGSRNIMKLESLDGIGQAVAEACETSFEKKAIVEEYLTGDEYSMESISFGGKHHFLAVTKKFTTGAPHFIETGHQQPSDLSDETVAKAIDTIFRALDALHVENSASHAEFRVDNDGNIKIIEIGARMGGDCIGSDLVYLSTGHDFVRMVIDVACGNEPVLNENPTKRTAKIRFLFDQKDLDDFEQFRKDNENIIYRVSDFELENIGNVTDSSTRIGYYITLE